MKIFLLALSGLLLFDSSQGSTIPQGKQIRTLNTTLRTNFSGIYQRKNPCSGSEVETSLYKASHELHHHTKDDCWCDYTHKCSAIIRNFLQTIGNLIKFNNDPTGSFNFYLNTSISQKQRLTDDPNLCESLPTIVIEATDCKIPLSSGSHIPRGESFKYKDAHQFLGEEILPQANFSDQEDCKDQNTVPASFSSLQSATQNTTSDWFQSEESSSKDDDLKFPTTFSPSGPEDISQAVLYDLSRGTQSAYESKPKFFKTSLKLTPQADPESGTIQPRIHYTTTNLLEDPSHGEPSPQSVSESPGSLVPIPFPEDPNYVTISPSPSLEQPPQVSPPVFESSANQNEPTQFSAIFPPELSSPSSLTEGLAEPTAAPIGRPFFITTDLPPPNQFPNHPSDVFPPEDQNSVNQINDPQFSFVPLKSQPDMAVKYDTDTLNVLTSTYPTQFFDISSKPTSQNSSPHPTTYSEAQPNLLPSLRQTPQEDLRIHVSQPPVNFPGHPSEFNGKDLNYSTKLNRPPTLDDLSVESNREILTTDFGNQLDPSVPLDKQFSAQPISPLYQKFPGQLPYESSLPSTVSLPGLRTYEKGSSLTTPLPPLQYESREESREESKDRSATFVSHPSVSPYVVSSVPYSDSLVTSTPGLNEQAVSVSPVNSDSHLDQQPTSNKRFHSSSVTTVEETVTFDQKRTTPTLGIVLEQIPGSSANNFDPSFSGSNIASYTVPQQFSSVLPDSGQQQLPSTTTNRDDGSRLLINPEDTLKSTPAFNYMEFSTTDSQISDTTLNPNNEQVLRMPETSQTVPLPVAEESQLLEPEHDPSNGLLYMTTPMPSAPNSGTTTPIAPEGKLTSASTSSSSSTTIDTYRDEYDFQTPSQQRVPANLPPVDYSGQIESSLPPASDSLVRSDYLPTAAPQPFTGNVDGFVASTPDNSLTYDPAPVMFTDSPQQNWPLVNFETNPSTTGSLRDWSEPQGVSSSLPAMTPRPEGYTLQPLVSTSNQRFQEEQFSTDKMSSESVVSELPQGMFSQEQLKGEQDRGTNPADVYSATEGNFRTPSLSTTPVYPNQLPTEADTKQIFESQIENEFREQSSKNPLYSLKQTTDSVAPLRPLSQKNTSPADQYPSTFPSPNASPGHIDDTTPTSFLPQPNQEFAFNRPSSSPDSFVMETTPGKPDFQQSSANSEQFSNFNSQPLSPDVAVDSSKPQITTIPLAGLPSSPYWNDNFGQTTPVSSSLTVSSTKDLSADALTAPPVEAFSTPQDAGTVPNDDSPAMYPLQTSERPQFFTSSAPQPTFPIQSVDKSTQTTPPEPFVSFPPISINSQPRNSDLVIQTPELSFNQPLLLQTNIIQPPTSLPVAEIITTPSYPEKPGLQYAGEETTPQTTSSGFQTYVSDDSRPQAAFDSQSVESTTSLQETELSSGKKESQPGDFGQNPNYKPAAAEESVAADSSSLPQHIFQQTTSIQETTATDRFSSGSTESPFLEPLLLLPESTAEGEIKTTQQQSSLQTPNYANPELTNSFDPLVSQEISNLNVRNSATAESSLPSFAILQQQRQSLSDTVSTPTVTPEPPLSYADRPTSDSSRKEVTSVASDSVESVSSQQGPQGEVDPVHFSSAESQTVSQVSSNVQEREERFPETSPPVNVQPYGYYNQPRPIFNQQFPNYYNGNFPPRALPGQYPAPNYMRNPHLHSENYPPFYGQQPVPQISDSQPSPSPPKSELTVQQVTESETTSFSTEPQTQPGLAQSGPNFSSGEQSTTSEERAPGNVPYPQNPANPNGLMMPNIPNYNAFRPEDRYLGPQYPVNSDPRLPSPNQQNFPPYYNSPYSYPGQRPVPPPMNQVIDDRQIIRAQPGREMGVPSNGLTFRQQTEERFLMESRPGVAIPAETGSQPLESQPTPENQLRNPLLQALHSQLVVPMQDNQDQRASFPERSDYNEQLSLDRMNGSQIYNAPAGQWNPRINFVNLQQNTALDAPRDVLQPNPHALVPDQTTPSNEPGEDSVSYCERDTPLLCLFDPASKGNMTAPSYVILISKLPGGAGDEKSVRVEKVYLGGGPLLACTWGEGEAFPTALYTTVPFPAATAVTLRPKSDSG